MIYRTLHTYILRELLRIFLLTATALTTLLAFGGTFRPLTKQGIEVSQLMVIMLNLMPAMLAYAIPIAALFAAVLVYWRMSTDNELTACRAGGISFIAIVAPAFILGLAVASVDLVFVNYVVPRFLQSTERAVRRDLANFIVGQIGRQEKFQMDPLPLVVSADSAELQPSDDPGSQVVILQGVAASYLDRSKPSAIVVGQKATVTIKDLPEEDATEVSFNLTNASAFNPGNAFTRYSGSVDSLLLDGRPMRIPSILKSKPKFLNWRDLLRLDRDPYLFPPVTDVVDRIEVAHNFELTVAEVQRWWLEASRGGKEPVTFDQTGMGGSGTTKITLSAGAAAIDQTKAAEQSLTFTGKLGGGAGKVKVEERRNGKLVTTYTCNEADLILSLDEFTNTGMNAQLQLRGNMTRENHEQGLTTTVQAAQMVGVVLPPEVKLPPKMTPEHNDADKAQLVSMAKESKQKSMQDLAERAAQTIQKLDQTITSELHSRGSFSLSCLTLVLFGAALGILLRGKNPLAVFVVGFVPAVVLVLLITAGRELTEGKVENVKTGICLIWAGNAVLLLLVAGVYAKLLRQ